MIEWIEAHPVVGGGLFTLAGILLGWMLGRKDMKDGIAAAVKAAKEEVGAHGIRVRRADGTVSHLVLDRTSKD